MTPAEIIAVLQATQTIGAFVARQVMLMRQNGELTEEQRDQITAAAEASRVEWDRAVDEAKQRIAEGESE